MRSLSIRGRVAVAGAYLDTSALAEWYVNENGSGEVEEYVRCSCPVRISLVTIVEMRPLLARRRRHGGIDSETEAKILAAFNGAIAEGHLVLPPHASQSFVLAGSLLGAHQELPLHTLDALHLGVMRAAGVGVLATADRLMAAAGAVLGTECRGFFSRYRGRFALWSGSACKIQSLVCERPLHPGRPALIARGSKERGYVAWL